MVLSHAVWRKSACSYTGSCVEIALWRKSVAVRDSKDRSRPVLVFTHAEWDAFLSRVRYGEFDLSR